MTVSYYNFISLFPIIVLGSIILLLLIIIICKRNYLSSTMIVISGLMIILITIIFFKNIQPNGLIGILFLSDKITKLYTIFIVLSSLTSCIFSNLWLKNYLGNKEEFYILLLISTLGCIVLINSNHMSSLLIGIELMSLPISGLICYDFLHKNSLESAIKYSVISSISSAFLLFGISLLYFDLGYLSFSELASKIFYEKNIINSLLLASIGLIIIGFFIKLSIFPFYLWSPDIDQGSRSSVIVFISNTTKITMFFLLTKIFIFLLPIFYEIKGINSVLNLVCYLSILFGNIMAIKQNNIKRLLNYSSISHFGYLIIILMTILKTKSNNLYFIIESLSIYLFTYLINNLCIYGILNVIDSTHKIKYINTKNTINLYRGLYWQYPTLSILFTIVILSLAGIPVTLGFISKFYLFALAIKENLFYLIPIMLIGSLISYYYYLKLIINLFYFTKKNYLQKNYNSFFVGSFLSNISDYSCKVIILIFSSSILILGIYPEPIIKLFKTFII